MNKNDLIEAMAHSADISKAAAERAFNVFTEQVTNALKEGDKVTLVGFGTFEATKRAARTGRNPQTGKEMQIPESMIPKFKAGKKLKDAVKLA